MKKWKWLKAIFKFFKTPLGKKVKEVGTELSVILTDEKPDRPQLKELGKKHGREFAYFGLTAGEDFIHKMIDKHFKESQAVELKRKLDILLDEMEKENSPHSPINSVVS